MIMIMIMLIVIFLLFTILIYFIIQNFNFKKELYNYQKNNRILIKRNNQLRSYIQSLQIIIKKQNKDFKKKYVQLKRKK